MFYVAVQGPHATLRDSCGHQHDTEARAANCAQNKSRRENGVMWSILECKRAGKDDVTAKLLGSVQVPRSVR